MLLLSANSALNPLLSNFSNSDSTLLLPHSSNKPLSSSAKQTPNSSHRKPLPSINASSSSLQNPNALHFATENESPEKAALVSSASAVASAIRGASTSPVEFAQRIKKDPKSGLVLPSSDFQRLCVEQLDLFRRIIDPEALLSVSFG